MKEQAKAAGGRRLNNIFYWVLLWVWLQNGSVFLCQVLSECPTETDLL